MSGKRFVGLSSRQPVAPLLSKVGRVQTAKKMKDVDVDAPPLSSPEQSDDDGPSTRGNIQPSRFTKVGSRGSRPFRKAGDGDPSTTSTTSATRFKRTLTSTGLRSGQPSGSRPSDTGRLARPATTNDSPKPPASKKPRRNPPGSEEPSSQSEIDPIFGERKRTITKRYGATRTVDGRIKDRPLPTKKLNRRPKNSTPVDQSPERRINLKLPPSPSKARDETPSPIIQLILPPDDLGSPLDLAHLRKLDLKLPADNSPSPEGSQQHVLRLPDELPDPFTTTTANPRPNLTDPPTAAKSSATNFLHRSTSPVTNLDYISDPTPVCPLCRKPVEQTHLDDFTTNHPRMSVKQMSKFCTEHQRRTARETWVQKGYPDIDWGHFDGRIAQHYDFLRRILEDEAASHYGDVFRAAVRAGRNRTTLRSDANLTPGYYGIRGLRAMTENLVYEFSSVLRRRAVEDRLVSARGHTVYVQSVLVPELAVRMIMEDMSVAEEEAREILEESSNVGELLNDEIPDVVVLDEDVEDNWRC